MIRLVELLYCYHVVALRILMLSSPNVTSRNRQTLTTHGLGNPWPLGGHRAGRSGWAVLSRLGLNFWGGDALGLVVRVWAPGLGIWTEGGCMLEALHRAFGEGAASKSQPSRIWGWFAIFVT